MDFLFYTGQEVLLVYMVIQRSILVHVLRLGIPVFCWWKAKKIMGKKTKISHIKSK